LRSGDSFLPKIRSSTVNATEPEFHSIVNLTTLRADLKRSLVNELNTGNEGFNPADFRATLEGTLSRLQLPVLRLELGDISRSISANFSGEIRNEQKMDALRQALQQSLKTVLSNLLATFKSSVDELRNQLAIASDSLGNELTKDLQKELTQLKSAFSDKEEELRIYAEILEVIT